MSVTIERDGVVLTILIHRPKVRNCVNRETAEKLRNAFLEFDADEDLSIAILGGVGGHFCAGYDLKEAANGLEAIGYDPTGHGPMGPTRLTLTKPVIAAIDGFAVAGGLELAIWCDLRIVEEDATFGVFCRRWGVPLVDGGTVRLPRLIGQSRALDMILTGRSVGAHEALSWGLANRVVPKGTVHQEALSLAKRIAEFPQLCLQADRRSALTQWGLDTGQALMAEGQGGLSPLETESRRGAAQFRDGRGRHGRTDDFEVP